MPTTTQITAKKKLNASHSNENFVEHKQKGLLILQSPTLQKVPGLIHGFSTRLNGHSRFPEGSLNLGRTPRDSVRAIKTNQEKFLSALGTNHFQLIRMRQRHTDRVTHVAQPLRPAQSYVQADASFTQQPNLLLAVQTADCAPIFFYASDRRSIAAVHAGWRGTAKRIVEKTLGLMRAKLGTRPENTLAVIGPSIRNCCYEVDSEVFEVFHSQFHYATELFLASDQFGTQHAETISPLSTLFHTQAPPGHQRPSRGARYYLDLVEANRRQMLDAGVSEKNIFVLPFCTACRTDLFFSHRKENGRTGRLLSVIGLAR